MNRSTMSYSASTTPRNPKGPERSVPGAMLTRKLCLHDQYFPTLDSVIVAAENEFSGWVLGSVTLGRLCTLILNDRSSFALVYVREYS